MSDLNLACGRWRLHMYLGDVSLDKMVAELEKTVLPFGLNTDILLQFTPQPSELDPSAPESLKVMWYRGSIEMKDPKHDPWDEPEKVGNFWAKVFPTTHSIDRRFVQLIQESFQVPENVPGGPNGNPGVRIVAGQYIQRADGRIFFFGHGADNLLATTVTFTLTYEPWPEQ